MNTLRQVKIGARLGLAFATVLLLLTLLGGFGMYQTSQANFYAKDLGTNWLPSIKVIGDIRASLNRARRAGLSHLLESSPEAKLALQKRSEEELGQKLPKLFAQYEPLIASAEEKQSFEKMRSNFQAWLALENKLLQLSSGNASDQEAARQMAVGDSARAFSVITAEAEKLVMINVDGADKSTAAATVSYQQALLVSIGMIALAVLMGAVLAMLVTRSITQPLVTGVAVAEAVAEGDLTTQFDIQGRDEPADLLRALQYMNERLVDIVGQVRLSSDSIATGSAEIA
ncbi:MAG: methyl-accepting chemotaxis protein, partial [Curvibacter sp.]